MFSRKVAMTPSIGLDELRHELMAGGVILFDALSTEEYRSAHIPGAVHSMPPDDVGQPAVVRTGAGFGDRRVRLERRM